MITFKCDSCGLCCQNLDKNPIYEELHDGDGICKHYHSESKKCLIYEDRPIFCRVDEGFNLFRRKMDLETYLALNTQACLDLKHVNKD